MVAYTIKITGCSIVTVLQSNHASKHTPFAPAVEYTIFVWNESFFFYGRRKIHQNNIENN